MELVYIRVAVFKEVFVYWKKIIVSQLDTRIKKTFSSLNKEHDFSRHKSILQNNIVSNNLTGVYHIDCTTKVAYSQRNFRILIFVDAI